MGEHWSTQLLGRPWQEHALGPEAFDCWGIVHFVYRQQLGVELPTYLHVNSPDFRQRGVESEQFPNWKPLDKPENFALVALGMGRRITHVGLYLEIDRGLVMHCAQATGVILQTMKAVRSQGWRQINFFQWQPST